MWAVVYTDELGKTVVDLFPKHELNKATEWKVRMISLGLLDAKLCDATNMSNIHS